MGIVNQYHFKAKEALKQIEGSFQFFLDQRKEKTKYLMIDCITDPVIGYITTNIFHQYFPNIDIHCMICKENELPFEYWNHEIEIRLQDYHIKYLEGKIYSDDSVEIMKNQPIKYVSPDSSLELYYRMLISRIGFVKSSTVFIDTSNLIDYVLGRRPSFINATFSNEFYPYPFLTYKEIFDMGEVLGIDLEWAKKSKETCLLRLFNREI